MIISLPLRPRGTPTYPAEGYSRSRRGHVSCGLAPALRGSRSLSLLSGLGRASLKVWLFFYRDLGQVSDSDCLGIIEKSVIEGQRGYYKALDIAMRRYIAENRKEFLPEGVDAAMADHEAEVEEAALSPAAAEHPDLITGGGLPVPSSRGLQWALDTFEGASKVAKDSFTGALDIIGDIISGLDTSSVTLNRTTILTVTVIVLLISNVYTILTMGDMEAKGRRKALEKRGEEREKWVGEAVRAFIEAQRSMSEAAMSTPSSPPLVGVAATPVLEASTSMPAVPTALEDVKAEVKSLVEAADALERRIAVLKNQLEELD